jgi:hypothetical protein
MKLAALIQFGPIATATVATLATVPTQDVPSVASVASVAVATAPQDATWTDADAERAAIAEIDGGAPRAWAEALARLDAARPPGDVPVARWRQFIDDCGRFLDFGWATQAMRLGWQPADLFGCDRHKPFARIDRMGLLWLLNGRKLLALTDSTATIACANGVAQRYYRAPLPDGAVLTWELAR